VFGCRIQAFLTRAFVAAIDGVAAGDPWFGRDLDRVRRPRRLPGMSSLLEREVAEQAVALRAGSQRRAGDAVLSREIEHAPLCGRYPCWVTTSGASDPAAADIA
jgi:hypothetical protein